MTGDHEEIMPKDKSPRLVSKQRASLSGGPEAERASDDWTNSDLLQRSLIVEKWRRCCELFVEPFVEP